MGKSASILEFVIITFVPVGYDPLKQINRVFLPDSALYFNENREFKVTDRRTLIHSERWYEKFDAYIKAFCDVQPQ